MPGTDYRLGIDVGGTNTDAVVMDPADRVIAKAKVPGTPDITSGIIAAIDAVLTTPGVEPRPGAHHPGPRVGASRPRWNALCGKPVRHEHRPRGEHEAQRGRVSPDRSHSRQLRFDEPATAVQPPRQARDDPA